MKQTEFVIKSSAKGNDADDTYENDMMCDYDYYGDKRKRRVVEIEYISRLFFL